jgi:hypothetical protein
MASKLLLFTLLISSTSYGLAPGAQKAIDTYVIQRAGASKQCAAMIAGIDDKTKKYMAEAEKAIRDDVPVINELKRSADNEAQIWEESVRLGQSTNWDIYTDPNWMREMRGEITRFCCEMESNPGQTRKGLVYQRLHHSGGGDAQGFQSNDLNANGPGLGRGRKGGGGGGRGRGRRGGGGGAGGGGQ